MHPYTRGTTNLKLFLSDYRTLNVVHYACESFYGKTAPTRICAIAVNHAGSKSSRVFSIHKICIEKSLSADAVLKDPKLYETLEKQLLEDFFEYAKEQGQAARWLNWNMNSETYGFAHLEGAIVVYLIRTPGIFRKKIV